MPDAAPCPHCGARVLPSNLPRHTRRRHPEHLAQPTRQSTRSKRPPRTVSATTSTNNVGGPSKRNCVPRSSTQDSRSQQAGKLLTGVVCDLCGTTTKNNRHDIVVCSGCSCGAGTSRNREYHLQCLQPALEAQPARCEAWQGPCCAPKMWLLARANEKLRRENQALQATVEQLRNGTPCPQPGDGIHAPEALTPSPVIAEIGAYTAQPTSLERSADGGMATAEATEHTAASHDDLADADCDGRDVRATSAGDSRGVVSLTPAAYSGPSRMRTIHCALRLSNGGARRRSASAKQASIKGMFARVSASPSALATSASSAAASSVSSYPSPQLASTSASSTLDSSASASNSSASSGEASSSSPRPSAPTTIMFADQRDDGWRMGLCRCALAVVATRGNDIVFGCCCRRRPCR